MNPCTYGQQSFVAKRSALLSTNLTCTIQVLYCRRAEQMRSAKGSGHLRTWARGRFGNVHVSRPSIHMEGRNFGAYSEYIEKPMPELTQEQREILWLANTDDYLINSRYKRICPNCVDMSDSCFGAVSLDADGRGRCQDCFRGFRGERGLLSFSPTEWALGLSDKSVTVGSVNMRGQALELAKTIEAEIAEDERQRFPPSPPKFCTKAPDPPATRSSK